MNQEELSAIAKYCSLQPYPLDSASTLELNLTQLGIIRNYAYALRGVVFKNKTYSNFYSQFFWDTPDPAIKAEDVKLKYEENKFIAKIKYLKGKKK